MSLRLDIPDSVVQGLRLPEEEIPGRLRTELAIALYAQGVLSLGKAAELAEMSRLLFG
jgi:predicted HTH domain antitoxin